MDILDLDIDSMYFESPLPDEVEGLINRASEKYGESEAELLLLRAFFKAPDHLTVLVALYRYYYYQIRLDDALKVAEYTIAAAAKSLHLQQDWRIVKPLEVAAGAHKSVGLVRFYLLALKAMGIVQMRLGDIELGQEVLRKVISLDPKDRLKTVDLLAIAESYQIKEMANTTRLSVVG